jgi:hypothetical protein
VPANVGLDAREEIQAHRVDGGESAGAGPGARQWRPA